MEAVRDFYAPIEARPMGTSAVSMVPESEPLIQVIARIASDPHGDVSKLERLVSLYERIEEKHQQQAFDAAMAEAQTKMRPVVADADNPQTRSKYATYAALDRALRPRYTEKGFSLSFNTGDGAPETFVRVVCTVAHSSGARRTYHIDMPADGKGAKGGDVMTKTHATGSAVTYGMRYLLKMIFNIAVGEEADDDGNAAAQPGGKITEAQVLELREMLDATGSDIERFCRYFKIDAVPDLPAKDLERAKAAIKAKGGKK